MRDLFIDPEWLAFWKKRVVDGMMEKYGVDNVFKHPKVIAKIQSVMLERYGKKHALQVEEFIGKYWSTCIDRFGCHPMHVPEIRQRQIKNSRRGSFAFKRVRIEDKVFMVQGYEDFVLRCLVKKFSAEDIVDQPKQGIKMANGSRYYPDFYIKSRKTYVEVKGDFTLLRGHKGDAFEKNAYKAREAQRQNKRVKWLIAFPKTDCIVTLPDDWHTRSKDEIVRIVQTKHQAKLDCRAA